MTVIAGICLDHLGLALKQRCIDAPKSLAGFRIETRGEQVNPTDLHPEQPPTIPIDRDHDGQAIGLVEALLRSRRGDIWAVSWINDDAIDPAELAQLSYSIDAHRMPGELWKLDSVAVTSMPAMSCAAKLHVIADAHDGIGRITSRQLVDARAADKFTAVLLERARDTVRQRRGRVEPLEIVDACPYEPPRTPWLERDISAGRARSARADANGIWRRGGGRIISVS